MGKVAGSLQRRRCQTIFCVVGTCRELVLCLLQRQETKSECYKSAL